MFQAVFQHHLTFVVLAFLITALVTVGVARAARKSTRRWFIGAFAGSVTAVLLLTLWSTGGSDMAPTCVINHNVLEPFSEEQGLLNLGMFVPVGLLGTLSARHAWPAILFGVTLTACIELTQGLLPVIGRACDTSDFMANAAGAVLGGLAGWLFLQADRQPGTGWPLRPGRVVAGFGAVWLVGAFLGGFYIHTSIEAQTVAGGPADDQQASAVTQAVREAFGDHYPIQRTAFFAGPGGTGTVMAYLPSGFLQINWPQANDVTVSIEPGTSEDSGYPVAAVDAKLTTKQQALSLTSTYAKQHFPWGLTQAHVQVDPVGPQAQLGWVVSWRRYRAGILMPMRLDVEIDRHGRVSQLHALNAADPSLPAVTVSAAQAAALANHAEAGCEKATPTVLMALPTTHGTWTPAYRVVLTCGTNGGLVIVDAHNGTVLNHVLYPAQAAPSNPADGDVGAP
ncbi:VanZ family protein [Streptacidiphilus monticola]|uniref:VanZ family protein n=1 Tax=Streptacidiphilus monticola TaxID=2161674 RepID=A0ABW1G7A8_9ACTN